MKLMNIASYMALVVLVISIIIISISVIENKEVEKGYTELYFYGELAQKIDINEKQHFSFAIHNLEKRTMTYYFEILIQTEKIHSGNVVINNNEIAIINSEFTVKRGDTLPSKITIKLLNNKQEIFFWVDN